MSYNRRFKRTVSVSYSGSKTVNYPASERGGSMTVYYSGTAHEDVNVDIHVDTTPFDRGVDKCNNMVNGLTASVGAMNAAQCAAIAENADKISRTLIKGFFQSVRTDLETQRLELQQTVETRLLLLRQQAARLQEIQKNMSEDYARTTRRYQDIFNDINNELSVRIHQVDQPVFSFVEEVDAQSDRMLHTDMVQNAVTMGKESSMLQAQLNIATMKSHALQAMGQAQVFLTAKATTESTLQNAMVEGSGKDAYLIPVCYMQTESDNHRVEQKCVMPEYYSATHPKLNEQLCDQLAHAELGSGSAQEQEQLKSYVQSEISRNVEGNDEHSNRVRMMINKLLN